MAKLMKECTKCHNSYTSDCFTKVKSPFFPDRYLPICNTCIENFLLINENNFDFYDKLCQWADIPFLAEEWMKLYEFNKEKTFSVYAKMYCAGKYGNVDWSDTTKKYKELAKEGKLDNAIPALQEEKLQQLREKWGPTYDTEELIYLENLFQGILNTQNVVGEIQLDNAKKLCKISLIIDNKIRGEEDFKDELASYEKLVKVADFTPKNVKNANDFNSVGELFAFLEKRGWINKFYDGAEKDIIDNTMKNIQLYVRNLYVNETGISEEIERRIEGLKIAQELEDEYNTPQDDLDKFEIAGYNLEEQFEEEIE